MDGEFSFRTRQEALRRFREETFDLLVIGGGITGTAVARDAASRGLSVALVECEDFASGTSSRSSKLIHGGLRYLENFEFGMVFEALSERAFLLRTAPHMVKPLRFFMPVYKGDANGRLILTLGLWFYDILALFRSPEFHKYLSRDALLKLVPFLKKDGLKGGFRYYDASMWDDVLTIETARAASRQGAAIASRVEAVSPIWNDGRIEGFTVRDRETGRGEIALKARRVVACGGPWTDELGGRLGAGHGGWKPWLTPSKGVHLIFDLKRIPVPGAMVMSHPEDGRISFVIPRPDFGAGVVIVGTTDAPSPENPREVEVERSDVDYLLRLLNRYFPDLAITTSDILSAYVGVRPLFGESVNEHGTQTGDARAEADRPGKALQKVSREHHIGRGPGGTIVVAGGKYTTHRKMAEQIVDFTLESWEREAREGKAPAFPLAVRGTGTEEPVNPKATAEAVDRAWEVAKARGLGIPPELVGRYGADGLEIVELARALSGGARGSEVAADPEGFPCLEAQLRYSIRNEMTLHLEDFYLRRMPLYAARADHGRPWAAMLAGAWAQEFGLGEDAVHAELERLEAELARNSGWRERVT
ncbi:MAG: glycerol-3-phosphate dehydrogenase/oxidase [Oligoflexia bacterium]|nr:glycerol-3-phosphate dehydrogenase/oxidase [Oligoflexia bacterium]